MNTKIVIFLAVIAAVALGLGFYFFAQPDAVEQTAVPEEEQAATSTEDEMNEEDEREPVETIGSSVEKRDVIAYN